MDTPDFTRLLDGASSAMESVGAFQVAEWRTRRPGWGDEKMAKELVSFVDVESERRLAAALTDLLPGSAFYGEETLKEEGDLTWVVDPIDGTTNYLSGSDWFCVSVALYDREGPLLGLIHRPVVGEWFWSHRGGGVLHRYGSRPTDFRPEGADLLARAAPCPLSASLVGTGTPYRSPDTIEAFFATAGEVLAVARDLRRQGSAALELAYLAAGWLQAFWEVDLQPYDVAASLLFLRELGCVHTTIGGAAYDPFRHRSLVAGLPGATDELLAIVARHYGGLRDWNGIA